MRREEADESVWLNIIMNDKERPFSQLDCLQLTLGRTAPALEPCPSRRFDQAASRHSATGRQQPAVWGCSDALFGLICLTTSSVNLCHKRALFFGVRKKTAACELARDHPLDRDAAGSGPMLGRGRKACQRGVAGSIAPAHAPPTEGPREAHADHSQNLSFCSLCVRPQKALETFFNLKSRLGQKVDESALPR